MSSIIHCTSSLVHMCKALALIAVPRLVVCVCGIADPSRLYSYLLVKYVSMYPVPISLSDFRSE